jgi:hypothetical protein
MKTLFQVTENYGNGSEAYTYFETDKTDNVDELKSLAINSVKESYRKETEVPRLIGHAKPPYPTIYVSEYKDGKKVKNGIKFKTKWR